MGDATCGAKIRARLTAMPRTTVTEVSSSRAGRTLNLCAERASDTHTALGAARVHNAPSPSRRAACTGLCRVRTRKPVSFSYQRGVKPSRQRQQRGRTPHSRSSTGCRFTGRGLVVVRGLVRRGGPLTLSRAYRLRSTDMARTDLLRGFLVQRIALDSKIAPPCGLKYAP